MNHSLASLLEKNSEQAYIDFVLVTLVNYSFMPSSPLKFRTALLRCARLFSDEVNTLLLPHQLNYSLWQVLYVIHLKQQCTQVDIAAYLKVSKPSITKRIRVLLDLGLIHQLESSDKRQKCLTFSSHGQELFKHCSSQIDQFEQQLLQSFAVADIAHTREILNQLSEQLQPTLQGEDK